MNPLRKLLIGGTLAATTLAGGALGASLVNGTAGAETASTTASTPATSTASTASAAPSAEAPSQQAPPQGSQGTPPDPSKGGHQANGVTETLLTGTEKSKAEAAATAEVSGATVDRSETDAEGAAFEVHMTKSDGSHVTVKLDSSYKVTEVIDGMG